MINLATDIQSLTTFRRSSGDFMKHLKKSKRPMVLTVNGKAAAVVQDAEAYQRLLDIAARADAGEGIRQGQDDAKKEKTRPVRQFFAEFEATHVTAGGVQLRAGWALQRAWDAHTGQLLSDSPRVTAKLMLTAPGPWAGSRLGANLVGVGARRSVGGTEVAGYARLNTHLTLAPSGQPWSLGVALYNLTGQRYADPGGPEHIEDALARSGRELQVRLGWAF